MEPVTNSPTCTLEGAPLMHALSKLSKHDLLNAMAVSRHWHAMGLQIIVNTERAELNRFLSSLISSLVGDHHKERRERLTTIRITFENFGKIEDLKRITDTYIKSISEIITERDLQSIKLAPAHSFFGMEYTTAVRRCKLNAKLAEARQRTAPIDKNTGLTLLTTEFASLGLVDDSFSILEEIAFTAEPLKKPTINKIIKCAIKKEQIGVNERMRTIANPALRDLTLYQYIKIVLRDPIAENTMLHMKTIVESAKMIHNEEMQLKALSLLMRTLYSRGMILDAIDVARLMTDTEVRDSYICLIAKEVSDTNATLALTLTNLIIDHALRENVKQRIAKQNNIKLKDGF